MGSTGVVMRAMGGGLLVAGIATVATTASATTAHAAPADPPPTVVVTAVPTPAPDRDDERGDAAEDLLQTPTEPGGRAPEVGPLEPPAGATPGTPTTSGALDTTSSTDLAPPLPRLLDPTPTAGAAPADDAVVARSSTDGATTLPVTGPGRGGVAGLALVAAGLSIVASAGRRVRARPAAQGQAAAT